MGVIIRTAGVGRTKTELQKDIQALLKIWETIETQFKDPSTKAPSLLYEGPNMVVRTVRDHFSNDMTEVLVDNKESFDSLNEFMKLVMPRMRNRIKFYQDTKPLFSQYNLEEQIERIYNRRVELPSGGSIVIDVGEAMVSIDVNSGRTTGASALEETAIKTNLEAAEEITRQLRLRDLGGLIVIDFIDMFQKKNKALLEKQVKLSCKRDRARVNISRISRFGLLEMSRQRLAPPVKEGFYSDCKHCGGTGHVKTDSSAALSVIRRIQEHLSTGNVKVLQVKVSTEVGNYLLNKKIKSLLELKEKNGVEVLFESEQYLPFENFSFTVLERKKEEDKVIEQKSNIQRVSSSEGEETQEEKNERRSRGRRPSSGRGRNRRPSSGVRDRMEAESSLIGPKPEGVDSSEEKTENSPRARRPASGRGRGRRPSFTSWERKTEENKVSEQKPAVLIGPMPEGDGSSEDKRDNNRFRRPSSGRGRGRRPGGRPGSRRTSRPPRNRTGDLPRAGERVSPENKSDGAGSSGSNPSPAKDSNLPPSSSPPKTGSERESNEDRQPMENVSRLHEVVIKNPFPFDPDPNRK